MSTSTETAKGSERRILAAIDGEITPVPVSPVYQLGLVLVTLGMILLPLVYLALIAFVGRAVFLYAAQVTSLLKNVRGNEAAFANLVPLLIGGTLLFFMVKPLFAPRRRTQAPLRLRRRDQPLLFAYVERLCTAMHAPVPREIRVDCQVNASAGFRRGIWSMLGTDLTLTIGMPLVAGLTLRQLSGLLAHEFGHFSQGAGMRMTYIIRMISLWFSRVVHERDAWDEELEAAANRNSGGVALILHGTRICISLTRGILWVFMLIGNAISGFMLRQMEFDADLHEAQLAGSGNFPKASRRMTELSVASQMALGDLRQFYVDGRLADDFPRLILANIDQITPELRKKILKQDLETRTGWFDTHPSTRDRIENIERERTRGIYRMPKILGERPRSAAGERTKSVARQGAAGLAPADGAFQDPPASILFRDFDELSRAATLEFYRETLERDICPEELHTVEALQGRQNVEIEAAKARARYMPGPISPLRLWNLPDDVRQAPEDAVVAMGQLKQHRKRLLTTVKNHEAVWKAWDTAETDELQAACTHAAFRSGARVNRERLSVEPGDLDEAAAAHEQARNRLSRLGEKLEAFEALAFNRLCTALQLLQTNDVQTQLDDPRLKKKVRRLLNVLRLLDQQTEHLILLRSQLTKLGFLCACIEDNQDHEGLSIAIQARADQMRRTLEKVRRNLGVTRYPFEHLQADMSLDSWIFGTELEELHPDSDVGAVAALTEQVLAKGLALKLRTLGHLAQIAERVEQALGLEPFPDPPDEKA